MRSSTLISFLFCCFHCTMSYNSFRTIVKRLLRPKAFSLYTSNSPVSSPSESLFSVGVIADIQYVDAPDAMNFQGNSLRKYRQSFDIFREAVSSWDALVPPPACALVLGDILDGKTAELKNQEKCINDVLNASNHVNYEMLYCFGNHCHYSFKRTDLYEKLSPKFLKNENRIENNKNENIKEINKIVPKDIIDEIKTTERSDSISNSLGGGCSPSKLYYDWSPCKDWRIISLDCYDISLIGMYVSVFIYVYIYVIDVYAYLYMCGFICMYIYLLWLVTV